MEKSEIGDTLDLNFNLKVHIDIHNREVAERTDKVLNSEGRIKDGIEYLLDLARMGKRVDMKVLDEIYLLLSDYYGEQETLKQQEGE